MVNNTNEHTRKEPAKQGAEAVTPKPIRIGASTSYDFQGSAALARLRQPRRVACRLVSTRPVRRSPSQSQGNEASRDDRAGVRRANGSRLPRVGTAGTC